MKNLEIGDRVMDAETRERGNIVGLLKDEGGNIVYVEVSMDMWFIKYITPKNIIKLMESA